MTAQQIKDPSVIVIGAGMTGILMMIKLREAGIKNVVILEKADKVGGTWRENTYPGVGCDVPAHMYTYSFRGNPQWSNRLAYGAEIQQYFEDVAAKYGVTEQVHFNEAVSNCNYRDGKWYVRTSRDRDYVADFVISATGILHHPAYPDIPGLDSFKGHTFHTARWDHSVAMQGKRVGIIGTGSTGAQVIPKVAKEAAKLTVFQRTPQWVLPLANKSYSEKDKRNLRKHPVRMTLLRKWFAWLFANTLTEATSGARLQHAWLSHIVKRNLKKQVPDPQLRAKLTPDYKIGCKRLVMSTEFLPAMCRDNVELEQAGIECITETGVRMVDGTEHELDVLVLSTGFHPFNFMRPMDLTGRDGISIDQAWSRKVQAYRGANIPGFPNFFLMLGPNSPIGNFSVIHMSEVYANYVIKLIEHWRVGNLPVVEATQEAKDEYNAYLKAGMGKTVWVGGCNSWYLDADGDPAMWPYSWKRWEEEMDEPILAHFRQQEDAEQAPVQEPVREAA